MAYTLPDLGYSYDALEPHFDARTMEIHHSKHHNAYVTKANAALEGTAWLDRPVEAVLRSIDEVPENVRQAVINNAGGHANHTLFFGHLSASGGGEPGGALGEAMSKVFGSYGEFKDKFKAAATARFGSGWAWLVVDGGGALQITDTKNQDSPLLDGHTPIMGLDVWEHAYYLKYQNLRPNYVDAFWEVLDWDKVAANYAAAK